MHASIKAVVSLKLTVKAKGLLIGGVAKLNRYVDIEHIKYPDGTPYIPGSSLKGRLRMLIEHLYGLLGLATPDIILKYYSDRSEKEISFLEFLKETLPDKDINSIAKTLKRHLAFFGTIEEFGPTRLHFSDLIAKKGEYEFSIDPRNLIDRLRGNALNPRLLERVRGTFEGNLSIIIVDHEDPDLREELYSVNGGLKLLRRGFGLLKRLGIGRGVSRGNGKIEEIKAKIDEVYPLVNIKVDYGPRDIEDGKLRENIEKIAKEVL